MIEFLPNSVLSESPVRQLEDITSAHPFVSKGLGVMENSISLLTGVGSSSLPAARLCSHKYMGCQRHVVGFQGCHKRPQAFLGDGNLEPSAACIPPVPKLTLQCVTQQDHPITLWISKHQSNLELGWKTHVG